MGERRCNLGHWEGGSSVSPLGERLWVPQSGLELILVEEVKRADLTDDKPPQEGKRPSSRLEANLKKKELEM